MSAALKTTTRLGRQGNSTGVTLTREVLAAAGMERGAEVVIEATPGRIVVTPVGGDHERFMAAFERSLERYDETYAILAK
jgi:antitoxin component of MazEF toxin-antitoxin module